MLPVLIGDVVSAARALRVVPASARPAFALRMFAEADLADLHRARSGRLHPQFGNGSLMSAARMHRLSGDLSFDDADCCDCFRIVLEGLIKRSCHGSRADVRDDSGVAGRVLGMTRKDAGKTPRSSKSRPAGSR